MTGDTKMKLNKVLQEQWRALGIAHLVACNPLEPELRARATEPLVETPHGVVLQSSRGAVWAPDMLQDETGYEAYANKIHVEDFLSVPDPSPGYVVAQGILFAEMLWARLKAREGKFTIAVSLDLDWGHVTVRFFMLRPNQRWLADDLDEYSEGIALWD